VKPTIGMAVALSTEDSDVQAPSPASPLSPPSRPPHPGRHRHSPGALLVIPPGAALAGAADFQPIALLGCNPTRLAQPLPRLAHRQSFPRPLRARLRPLEPGGLSGVLRQLEDRLARQADRQALALAGNAGRGSASPVKGSAGCTRSTAGPARPTCARAWPPGPRIHEIPPFPLPAASPGRGVGSRDAGGCQKKVAAQGCGSGIRGPGGQARAQVGLAGRPLTGCNQRSPLPALAEPRPALRRGPGACRSAWRARRSSNWRSTPERPPGFKRAKARSKGSWEGLPVGKSRSG